MATYEATKKAKSSYEFEYSGRKWLHSAGLSRDLDKEWYLSVGVWYFPKLTKLPEFWDDIPVMYHLCGPAYAKQNNLPEV